MLGKPGRCRSTRAACLPASQGAWGCVRAGVRRSPRIVASSSRRAGESAGVARSASVQKKASTRDGRALHGLEAGELVPMCKKIVTAIGWKSSFKLCQLCEPPWMRGANPRSGGPPKSGKWGCFTQKNAVNQGFTGGAPGQGTAEGPKSAISGNFTKVVETRNERANQAVTGFLSRYGGPAPRR
jgi:hypothetical protein